MLGAFVRRVRGLVSALFGKEPPKPVKESLMPDKKPPKPVKEPPNHVKKHPKTKEQIFRFSYRHDFPLLNHARLPSPEPLDLGPPRRKREKNTSRSIFRPETRATPTRTGVKLLEKLFRRPKRKRPDKPRPRLKRPRIDKSVVI